MHNVKLRTETGSIWGGWAALSLVSCVSYLTSNQ
jgi:hypothetical protein